MSDTILLVEDEANDVFFFDYCAKKAGFADRLQVVRDGLDALHYLEGTEEFANREKFPFPRLVILDLKLPRVTGFEVLERIRAKPKLSMLIVVVLTSSVSDQDIKRAYTLGANAYLVKPSDPSGLALMAQAIKDFWLTHNRPPP